MAFWTKNVFNVIDLTNKNITLQDLHMQRETRNKITHDYADHIFITDWPWVIKKHFTWRISIKSLIHFIFAHSFPSVYLSSQVFWELRRKVSSPWARFWMMCWWSVFAPPGGCWRTMPLLPSVIWHTQTQHENFNLNHSFAIYDFTQSQNLVTLHFKPHGFESMHITVS